MDDMALAAERRHGVPLRASRLRSAGGLELLTQWVADGPHGAHDWIGLIGALALLALTLIQRTSSRRLVAVAVLALLAILEPILSGSYLLHATDAIVLVVLAAVMSYRVWAGHRAKVRKRTPLPAEGD
jgi:hypothetical protein